MYLKKNKIILKAKIYTLYDYLNRSRKAERNQHLFINFYLSKLGIEGSFLNRKRLHILNTISSKKIKKFHMSKLQELVMDREA